MDILTDLGSRTVRQLYIDWIGLHSAFQMNVPEVKCFLSLEDGQVVKVAPGDGTLAMFRSAPDRYAPIEAIPSRIQYQWLDEFIKGVDDLPLRARLEASVNGKGAFRRFKDILLTLPDERRRWFEFRDQHMRNRIIDWIAEHGISPLNQAIWETTEDGVAYSALVNHPRDVEALRDFLIEWADQHHWDKKTAATGQPPNPLELEELAQQICSKFHVQMEHRH